VTKSDFDCIECNEKVNISADVNAKIITLHVNEDDWVDKGQLLVELDSEKYVASIRATQANAKLVKVNMDQAQRVYKHAKETKSAIRKLVPAYRGAKLDPIDVLSHE
jgi:multidrug efflux pump subunit AcrA (membrane-fusion protein)